MIYTGTFNSIIYYLIVLVNILKNRKNIQKIVLRRIFPLFRTSVVRAKTIIPIFLEHFCQSDIWLHKTDRRPL